MSALLMRGAGFLSSLMVARWAGPVALGLYSATVNTASSVSQAALGVVGNGATLSSGLSMSELGLRRLLWAYLGWVCLAFGALMGILYWALSVSGVLEHASSHAVTPALLVVVGGGVMAGSLVVATVSGLLAGAGQFLAHARVMSMAALLLMASAWPAVTIGGLPGALGLAGLTALVPALLSLWLTLRLASQFTARSDSSVPAWRTSGHHLLAGLPNAVAMTLNAGINWVCTIYLTQHAHGTAGVAVVAVSNQWLTLMLMPASSWGGMVMKELLADHPPGSTRVHWAILGRVVRRNTLVTCGVGGAVALCSGLITDLYGLRDHALQAMILVNVLSAIVSALSTVLERLFVCQSRQFAWLLISTVGLVVQLLVTYWGIRTSISWVPLGVVISNALIAALALWWLRLGASRVSRAA